MNDANNQVLSTWLFVLSLYTFNFFLLLKRGCYLERINVRRPLSTDSEELHELITYTFAKEGLAGVYDGSTDDWETKNIIYNGIWKTIFLRFM